MHRNCHIGGCRSAVSGFGIYCNKHRKVNKRNGHPLQATIRADQLRPFLRMVEERRQRNPDSPLWATLEARWSALVQSALDQVEAANAGHAFVRWSLDAARQVHTVSGAATPYQVVDTVLALHLMHRFEGRRFQSDRAFDFQVVRAVRRLGPQAAGTRWNQSAGKVQGVYRPASPRATEVLAAWLRDAFSGAGMQLADLEHAAEAKRQQEAQAIYQAVQGLR